MGIPVFAEGTMIYMPHGTFPVVEECSGFAALYAAIAIALVLAYLSRSPRRRVLLPFPLAMPGNVLRVSFLGVLAENFGYGILETPIHLLSGYLALILTRVALFLFAERAPRGSSA